MILLISTCNWIAWSYSRGSTFILVSEISLLTDCKSLILLTAWRGLWSKDKIERDLETPDFDGYRGFGQNLNIGRNSIWSKSYDLVKLQFSRRVPNFDETKDFYWNLSANGISCITENTSFLGIQDFWNRDYGESHGFIR